MEVIENNYMELIDRDEYQACCVNRHREALSGLRASGDSAGIKRVAEKLNRRRKKCQGTTSVVPKEELNTLRKNSTEEARSVRARLQSCRKGNKIMLGL
jgi:hypothetical protein